MLKPHISVKDHARLDQAVDALMALGRLAINYRYHQPMFDADPTSVSFGDVAPLLTMIDEQMQAGLEFDVAPSEEGE
jgi:hypothetical protein